MVLDLSFDAIFMKILSFLSDPPFKRSLAVVPVERSQSTDIAMFLVALSAAGPQGDILLYQHMEQ